MKQYIVWRSSLLVSPTLEHQQQQKKQQFKIKKPFPVLERLFLWREYLFVQIQLSYKENSYDCVAY